MSTHYSVSGKNISLISFDLFARALVLVYDNFVVSLNEDTGTPISIWNLWSNNEDFVTGQTCTIDSANRIFTVVVNNMTCDSSPSYAFFNLSLLHGSVEISDWYPLATDGDLNQIDYFVAFIQSYTLMSGNYISLLQNTWGINLQTLTADGDCGWVVYDNSDFVGLDWMLVHMSSIAFDPLTGNFYMLVSSTGDIQMIATINVITGYTFSSPQIQYDARNYQLIRL